MQLPIMSDIIPGYQPPTIGCQGCSACCQVQAVREIGKPYYTKCEHQNSHGCSIYSDRPSSCKGYSCFWNLGDEIHGVSGDPEARPDKSGVIFGITDNMGKVFVEVCEVWPLKMNEVLDKYGDFIMEKVLESSKVLPTGGIIYVPANSQVGLQFEPQPPYDPKNFNKGTAFKRILGTSVPILYYIGTAVHCKNAQASLPPFDYMMTMTPTIDEIVRYFKNGELDGAEQVAALVTKRLASPTDNMILRTHGLSVEDALNGEKTDDSNIEAVRTVFATWNRRLGFINFYA